MLASIYNRGIFAFPRKVELALTKTMLDQLKVDGHGVSFPDSSGCQMRFVRDGKDLGGFYSYNLYGGITKAVKAAMSRNQQLRVADRLKGMPTTPTAGVTWVERFDERRKVYEYLYRVFYKKPDGRAAGKSFYLGSGERPSADKQLHAFRTAKLFRHHYQIYGPDLDVTWFNPWKEVRLYTNDRAYFDWAKS